MDKFIAWLFQRTSDGATYNQVIILSVCLLFLLPMLIKEFIALIECSKEGEVLTNEENEM